MRKNKFDKAMDYIDANIEKSIDDIKRGFIDVIGYNSNYLDKCFRMLTNESLREYIIERKLFFVSECILENDDRKLCDIAQDFGYSEQSVLNRVMKAYYNVTPGEIRKSKIRLPNDKYTLSNFQDEKNDSRIAHVFEVLEQDGYVSPTNFEYMEDLYSSAEEYGFDLDIAYQIAELAERLGVPIPDLMQACFDLRLEGQDLSQKIAAIIDLGLRSEDELDEICDFYQCCYYDLDLFMVRRYYEIKKNNV